MNPLAVAAIAFALIIATELPDKTFLASLVLGSRYRALPVWLGVAAAFAVHVVIAVSLGSVVTLLPARVRDGVVAVLFAAGAAWLLLHREEGDTDARIGDGATNAGRVALTSFTVVFLAEWGDLTQIATVDLAARFADPVAVAAGAIAGLWAVGGLGVLAGNRVLARIPVRLLHLVTGVVLTGFAIASAVAALAA